MIRKAKLVDNNHEKTSSESESDEDIQKFTASFMQSVADPKERGRTKQKAKDSDEQSSDNETFAAENAQYDTDSTSDVDSSSEDEEEEQDTKRNSKSYGTEKEKIKERTKSDRIEQDEETSDADSSDGEGDADSSDGEEGADSSDGEGDADSNDGEGDEVVLPSSSRTNEKVGEDEEEHDEEEEEAESEGEENNIEDGVAALRKELADMPFAEVQKLKEKIGLKAFNEAMYGSGLTDRRGRRVFKRANRHRPMEMSSKIRVSQFREVIQVKKQVRRDPRFDDLSGEFNETIYKHTYSFLGDVRDREKQKLVKEMRKVKDTDRKKEIKALIRRMTDQENQEKQKDRQQERAMERKKKEQELVKQGKRPYFLKKSIEKKLDLAEKYSELKKSGTVEKYLSKKRKKAAAKDRKKLPYQSEPVR